MKKEHFEQVYREFECHLKHSPLNRHYVLELEREPVSNIVIKRQRSDPSLFMVTGREWVLFGRIQSFAVAEEILNYILETEILFT